MNANRWAVIIIVAGGLWFGLVTLGEDRHDRAEIDTWAQAQQLTLQKVERCYFSRGPYRLSWHRRIYRIETPKGIYWISYPPGPTAIYREEQGAYQRVQ
ncbi:MAG: hypothetical protein ACLPVW_00705 [Terriglobales bacterium]